MWQKCPICNGTGVDDTINYSRNVMNTNYPCQTCNGRKIISELTGRPPQSQSSRADEVIDQEFLDNLGSDLQ